MRTKATDSLAAWPEEVTPPNGVLVLSGYGLDVRVWRGRLRFADGAGRDRREGLVHRATGRLRRLVVLGHTGSVSLEAIRWLADIGAGYLQVDADGRVLAAFGPQGADRPALRRAQARALDTPAGMDLARRLVAEKVAAQAATLARVVDLPAVSDATAAALRDAAARLHAAATRDEIRLAEAQAAAAYWSALGTVPVRFAGRDADRVPPHWRTFGSRTSPLTGGPRLAANPANAILNYLYALLEGEAALAARVVGLDPGLGVLHADLLCRDSLAADLMEPVRPLVDRYALELFARRTFAAGDFFETRAGVCRVTPPLARELALTLPRWRSLVGRVAEDAARLLDEPPAHKTGAPTPITGRRRSAGRSGARPGGAGRAPAMPPVPRACSWCGRPLRGKRQTCGGECEARARAAQDRSGFVAAGVDRLRELAAAGQHPGHTAAAKDKLRASQAARRRATLEWNESHPERPRPERFRTEILPGLAGVSGYRLAKATGLSPAYCARIKDGAEVPHPMWWGVIRGLMTDGHDPA